MTNLPIGRKTQVLMVKSCPRAELGVQSFPPRRKETARLSIAGAGSEQYLVDLEERSVTVAGATQTMDA